MTQSSMPGIDPNGFFMGACGHHHHARTGSCRRCSHHVQEIHATDLASFHHHLLGCIQEDDFPTPKCGVKPEVIKLADRDQVGGEVRGMNGCFEGEVCMVAVIDK